jgi:DnaJ-class molecular chaperone
MDFRDSYAAGGESQSATGDRNVQRYRNGAKFDPPPGWDSGFESRGRGSVNGGGASESQCPAREFGGDRPARVAFAIAPQASFRVDGRDLHVHLALAPWEAALGALVTAHTPEGPVEIEVPAGSVAACELRFRGRGRPGAPPGDLIATLEIRLPRADTPAAREAYAAMARAFPGYLPRARS